MFVAAKMIEGESELVVVSLWHDLFWLSAIIWLSTRIHHLTDYIARRLASPNHRLAADQYPIITWRSQINESNQNKRKVQILWEGHKIWKISHLLLKLHSNVKTKWEFLWPSQSILTLPCNQSLWKVLNPSFAELVHKRLLELSGFLAQDN